VKKATEEMKTNMLQWPGNSNDLNPTENLSSPVKAIHLKMDCSTTKWFISYII
jgi:hypothetical protein